VQPNRTIRIKKERSGQRGKCKEYINNNKIKIKKKLRFTAMVCHFSLREMASSLLSEKYYRSLGSRSTYLRLSAIRPPCPLDQFLIEESVKRGLSPNIKTLC